jgi:predicted ATPase
MEGPPDTLLRSAGGNPLFLEETVRMLSDAGMLESGGWQADEDDVPVAGSLQTLIGSRLDLLPVRDRQVAQLASIGGLVFWSGLVSFLRGGNGDVADRLKVLEVRDLVRAHDVSSVAGEREWAFKHMLIRDVAYGRLPKRKRSELHARCADWVSGLSKTEEELVEIVAYHLETACTLARELGPAAPDAPVTKAMAALAAAGGKAERREGIREADRFYVRALEVAGSDSLETATELRLRRSRTLTALGRLGEATELLSVVAEDARQLGRLDVRGQALVQLANVAQKVGQASDAREYLLEARSIALDIGDLLLQVRAAYESASLQADFDGAVDAALDDLWLGLALAERLDDLALRTEGHLRLGTVLATSGRLAEAQRELERCAMLADETGSYRDDARATYLLAYVTYYLGEPEEAERLATKAGQWLERTADRYFQIQNALLLSRMALTRGEIQSAERWAREALPLAEELGGWLLVEACRYLVEILTLQRRTEEASRTAELAERNVPEEDAFAMGESRLGRALIAAADEGSSSSAAMIEEALGLMEGQGVPIELAEARISAARVLLDRGEGAITRQLLERARVDAGGTEARRITNVVDDLLA